jgi:hypothetical protein
MNDYVLNEKTEPVDMVLAFGLGHPLRLGCCPSLAGAGVLGVTVRVTLAPKGTSEPMILSEAKIPYRTGRKS